jgi:hypothetical protein
MRQFLFFMVFFVFVVWATCAFANENSTDVTGATNDNSIQYTIELGNGDGALLIIGDGNNIYMPPSADEMDGKIQPNEITYNADRDTFTVVLTETDIYINGVRTRYSKVILELGTDGWDLLWFEQERW